MFDVVESVDWLELPPFALTAAFTARKRRRPLRPCLAMLHPLCRGDLFAPKTREPPVSSAPSRIRYDSAPVLPIVAVPARSGQEDVQLLLEHRPFVLRLCRILLRDGDESEDASQQVFLNAQRALRAGVRPRNVRAWLAQIARNECRSRVRNAAARREARLSEALPAADGDPSEVAAQRILVSRLREELASLPARQREALLLREFRGLSYRELAQTMHETEPAVESLLQRGRRRLADRLGEARRPLAGIAFAWEWLQNVLGRLSPGPAATEAASAGGAAIVAAKLAAAGAVAVGVGVTAGDMRHTSHVVRGPARSSLAKAPPRPAPPDVRLVAPAPVSTARHSGRRGEGEHRGRGGDDSRSGEGRGGNSGPGSRSSGSGESGSGPSPSGSASSGSGSSGSGSGNSGSGDSGSSGPGDSGSGSSSSGSSGSDDSAPGGHGPG